MSFEFTSENKKEFEKILARYPNKMAATLPVLWLVLKQNDHISLEAQEYVAKLLDVTPAHVYGVVTFYTMFRVRSKPTGKYHLGVCRTLSCALSGGEDIIRHIEKRYHIRDGEVTKDGKFSIEEMECLGSCGTAPAMMVNEAYFEKLTPEKVDQLLDKLERQ